MSTATVLAYVASAVLIGWGSAHLAPTRAVAASFGAISLDSRRFLVMEWIADGVTHVALGLLVIVTTALDGAGDSTTQLDSHGQDFALARTI
jgi:hypothetical protein